MAHPVNVAPLEDPPKSARSNKKASKVDVDRPLNTVAFPDSDDIGLTRGHLQSHSSRRRSRSVDKQTAIDGIDVAIEESASRRKASRRTKSLGTHTSSDGASRFSAHGNKILGDEEPPSSIVRSKLRSDPDLARALLLSKQEEDERRTNTNKQIVPHNMGCGDNEVGDLDISGAIVEVDEPEQVVIPVTKRGRGRPKGTTKKLQLPAGPLETRLVESDVPQTSTVHESLRRFENQTVVQDICGRASDDVEEEVGNEKSTGSISMTEKGRNRPKTVSEAIDESVPMPTDENTTEIPQTLAETSVSAAIVPPAPARAAASGRKRAKTMPRLGRKVAEVSDTRELPDVEDPLKQAAHYSTSGQAVVTSAMSPDRQTTPLGCQAYSTPSITSPRKVSPAEDQVKTPKKNELSKGPDKHSPLTKGRTHRVGLSKRQRIPALLKIFRK